MPAAAATAIAHWSTPTSLGRSQFSAAKNKNTAILSNSTPTCKIASPPPSSISKVQYGYGYSKRNSVLTGFKPFSSPVMVWQDCSVKMEIDVPVGVAYNLYSDRESIPRCMPIISSVKVLKDKPDLSRWSLKYEGLGQNIEYSWLLTVSYEVPEVLVPVATAVQPILENLLRGGLERFAKLAESTLAD